MPPSYEEDKTAILSVITAFLDCIKTRTLSSMRLYIIPDGGGVFERPDGFIASTLSGLVDRLEKRIEDFPAGATVEETIHDPTVMVDENLGMNALFNSALRQSSAIRKDLDSFAESPSSSPPLQGQVNASLTSFSRTIDEYSKLSKQELVPAKQEKAYERVKNFRTELSDYRERFDRLKKQIDERQTVADRSELLGRRPHQTATPENPYSQPSATTSNPLFQHRNPHNQPPPGSNPYSSSSISPTSAFGTGPSDAPRETHALREQSFLSSTNAQLDEFLERGRAVLGDLSQQREVLKGTQQRLYTVANTLGISGDTIRMVERRAKQDKWIFWIGVVVFFGFCWLVLRWLR
ncbi:MAG: protein transport protein bos1 [Bathelium mastoideum]|nr:MAG: protein transport protein bos1 [Bathelium mastoideum]KAI9688039.1 MAG: protein transport protein bos1 [Bathelium mastoideum]